jgi:hypothetical protein
VLDAPLMAVRLVILASRGCAATDLGVLSERRRSSGATIAGWLASFSNRTTTGSLQNFDNTVEAIHHYECIEVG